MEVSAPNGYNQLMVSIRAHFDGKVFIPDEPVDVLPNAKVRILLVDDNSTDRPLMDLMQAIESHPIDLTWPMDGAAQHDHYLYGTPKHDSDLS